MLIAWLGLETLLQAGWQVTLNRYAGNGYLGGEQKTAQFELFGYVWSAPKVFRNRRRPIQAALGLSLMIIGIVL